MLRQILLSFFTTMALFSQIIVHTSTPIQWMDTIDHKLLAVTDTGDVNLFFSDGTSFVIPLPQVEKTRLISPQLATTENGINLITRRTKTIPTPDRNEPRTFLEFYHISFSDIRNGKTEWQLTRPSIHAPDFDCELVPINDNKYLACFSGSDSGIPGIKSGKTHDWVICGFNEKNKFIEYDSGDWLESGSSYFPVLTGEQTRSKFGNLTRSLDSSIVHTKNYLSICNTITGRMLVFSKETGKLVRRIKLTDAVPPEQDIKFVCMVPIIVVQPDLDDGIVVLARKDFDIAESIGIFEKYDKLKRQEKREEPKFVKNEKGEFVSINKPPESALFLRTFQLERLGVVWYRVNLEKGKKEKLNPPDVPYEWDDTRFAPYFIPFEYNQILFGGIEKSYQELIGSVFIKPVVKTEPKSSVRTEEKSK